MKEEVKVIKEVLATCGYSNPELSPELNEIMLEVNARVIYKSLLNHKKKKEEK